VIFAPLDAYAPKGLNEGIVATGCEPTQEPRWSCFSHLERVFSDSSKPSLALTRKYPCSTELLLVFFFLELNNAELSPFRERRIACEGHFFQATANECGGSRPRLSSACCRSIYSQPIFVTWPALHPFGYSLCNWRHIATCDERVTVQLSTVRPAASANACQKDKTRILFALGTLMPGPRHAIGPLSPLCAAVERSGHHDILS
jgi:hypothetical protein